MTTVSGVPFWESAPEVFGTVTLGKHTIRGVKDVAIKRGRKRDKKSAPGKNGAKLGNKGFEAATVKIEWHVCTVEGDEPSQRWDEAAAILADLEDKKRAEEALPIGHPFCQIRGITSVTVDTIEGPKVVESSGLFAFTLDCTEYTTPEASKKGGGGGKGGADGGNVPFEGTVVDLDASGKQVGEPRTATMTEPQPGVWRETSTGKRVHLILPFNTDPDHPGTPRQQAEAKRAQEAAQEAAQEVANQYTQGIGSGKGYRSGDGDDVSAVPLVEDVGGVRIKHQQPVTEDEDLEP